MAIVVRLWSETGALTYFPTNLEWLKLELTQNAEEGNVATSTLELDDHDGVLDIPGHRRIDVLEDSADPGEQLLYVGATTIREIDRGSDPTLGRRWTISMDDPNTLFHRRLLKSSSANRPAETDVARMTWLLTQSPFAGVFDTQYISSASPVAMGANDFRGQYVAAVMDDMAQQSGKNWYNFWNDTLVNTISTSSAASPSVITTSAAHKLGTGASKNWVTISGHSGSTPDINGLHLATMTSTTTFTIPVNVTVGGTGGTVRYASIAIWYDFSSSSAYASTLSISNDLADVDEDLVWPPTFSPRLKLDPMRIYSGVNLAYSGGSVYRHDAQIASAIVDRDIVAPSVNVTTQAKAIARANRYLADNRTDERIVEFGVELPATHVNKILPGHLLPMKATHLPGMEDFANVRVLNRTVRHIGLDRYTIDLEASVPDPCDPAYTGSDWTLSRGYLKTVAKYENTGQTPTAVANIVDGLSKDLGSATDSNYLSAVWGAGTYYRGWDVDFGELLQFEALTIVSNPTAGSGTLGGRPDRLSYSDDGVTWSTEVTGLFGTGDSPRTWDYIGYPPSTHPQYTYTPGSPFVARYIRISQEFTLGGLAYRAGINVVQLLVRAGAC